MRKRYSHLTSPYVLCVENEAPWTVCSHHASQHSPKITKNGGMIKCWLIHWRRNGRAEEGTKVRPYFHPHFEGRPLSNNMEVDLNGRLEFPWQSTEVTSAGHCNVVPGDEEANPSGADSAMKRQERVGSWEEACQVLNFLFVVGCRGFPAKFVWRMFSELGVVGRSRKGTIQRLTQAAERASNWVKMKREEEYLEANRRSILTNHHCGPYPEYS